MKTNLIKTVIQSKSVYSLPDYQTDLIDWQGQIPFGFWITETLKPSVFVELGTYKGDSYCAFCQAVKINSLDTQCFAVDTWQGDEHTGKYEIKIFDDLKNYHDKHYAEFSRLYKMTFNEACEKFKDASIDLLHIDGLHTYEAVLEDYRNWLPKMSDRGVILLHDTQVRERNFGVWQLWEEIIKDFPSFELKHSNGLGVLLVGKNLPSPLISLSNASPADKKQIRTFFFILGDRIEKIALAKFFEVQKDQLYRETEKLKFESELVHRHNEKIETLEVKASSELLKQNQGLVSELIKQNKRLVADLIKQNKGIAFELTQQFQGLASELAKQNQGLAVELSNQNKGFISTLTTQTEGPLSEKNQGFVTELIKQNKEFAFELTQQLQGLVSEQAKQNQGLSAELIEQNKGVAFELAQQLQGLASELAKQSQGLAAELSDQNKRLISTLTKQTEGLNTELIKHNQVFSAELMNNATTVNKIHEDFISNLAIQNTSFQKNCEAYLNQLTNRVNKHMSDFMAQYQMNIADIIAQGKATEKCFQENIVALTNQNKSLEELYRILGERITIKKVLRKLKDSFVARKKRLSKN